MPLGHSATKLLYKDDTVLAKFHPHSKCKRQDPIQRQASVYVMVSGRADLLDGLELSADINHGHDAIGRGATQMSAAAVDSPNIEGHWPDRNRIKRMRSWSGSSIGMG